MAVRFISDSERDIKRDVVLIPCDSVLFGRVRAKTDAVGTGAQFIFVRTLTLYLVGKPAMDGMIYRVGKTAPGRLDLYKSIKLMQKCNIVVILQMAAA